MKNNTTQKRIKVLSFLKANQPTSYTAKQIERATGLKSNDIKSIVQYLLNIGQVRIAKQEPGTIDNYYQAVPGQTDISPVVGNFGKKPGRKTAITQAIAWEAIERDPARYSQKQKVYSFLLANQSKCFSRRQLEEILKLRPNNLTSILATLIEQMQVGIEKRKKCEYTGQSVYYYFAFPESQQLKIV